MLRNSGTLASRNARERTNQAQIQPGKANRRSLSLFSPIVANQFSPGIGYRTTQGFGGIFAKCMKQGSLHGGAVALRNRAVGALEVQRCSSEVQRCSSEVQRCGSEVQRCGSELQRCGSELQRCGSEVQRCSSAAATLGLGSAKTQFRGATVNLKGNGGGCGDATVRRGSDSSERRRRSSED